MGTWGHGLFDDDLALDVKGHFDRAVAGGASAADAAAGLMESELSREILEEFGADARDDMFWEENRGLFYAIASLQLEHGVLQEVVRQQTLQAIAVERRGLDPEQNRERWEILDALQAQLNRGADDGGAPARHQLAEGTNPALVVEVTMAKPPAKKAAAGKPAVKQPAKKPAKQAPAKKPAKQQPAKKVKAPAKKPVAKKPPAKNPPAKKPAKQPARKPGKK